MLERKNSHLLIAMIIGLIIFSGCQSAQKRTTPDKNSNSSNAQSKNIEKEKPDIPKILTEIENSLNKVITETSPPLNQAKQKANTSNASYKDNNISEHDIDWIVLNKEIEKVHTKWNTYEVQAIKDKVATTLITQFEANINLLTILSAEKKTNEIAYTANQACEDIVNMLYLYKNENPPEIKKMKYITQQINFNSRTEEWTKAEDTLVTLSECWNIAQLKMKNPKINTNTKITLAIEDLKTALLKRNKQIIELKAQIVIMDLSEIR